MKRFSINTGLIFASWALLLIFGCHKKKTPIPPEETPPTIISEMPIVDIDQLDQVAEQPPSEQDQTANAKLPEKPAPPKHPKHPAPKRISEEPDRPAPTEEARNTPPPVTTAPSPPRVVIDGGGGNRANGQAASGAGQDNGSNYQATTQQLLDSAENNLRNLKRQLSDTEQSMVSQIKDYTAQSKKATSEGDDVRAHNLAQKARLMSDELVKGQ